MVLEDVAIKTNSSKTCLHHCSDVKLVGTRMVMADGFRILNLCGMSGNLSMRIYASCCLNKTQHNTVRKPCRRLRDFINKGDNESCFRRLFVAVK